MDGIIPDRSYWWVRDRRFGTVDIVLQAGPRWYSFDSPDAHRSEGEIRKESDIVERVLPPFWIIDEPA